MEGIWNSLSQVTNEIVSSPLNILLLLVILYLLYRFLWKNEEPEIVIPVTPQIPALKKKDRTLAELKVFDGTDPDGRVCVAVNGKVFDVTRNGRRFYGPGNYFPHYPSCHVCKGYIYCEFFLFYNHTDLCVTE